MLRSDLAYAGSVLEPGTVLAEKFRVERVLGRGGMGTVVAATHLQLGTQVALKFIKPEIAARPGLKERFLREARASAQLRGEHVCRVFDVGTIDGAPYLVMELLEGVDLAKTLRLTGELPLGIACNYVLQTCAGLAVAHAAGIVHRDLKPGNLMVTRGLGGHDTIKVLDFGLAKVSEGEDDELTMAKNVIGSPAYMSPEQVLASHDVDARTDIWSIGVVLYELLTGKHPFVGDNLRDLITKINEQPAPHLPFDHPELDGIIRKCLAKEPARRYRDVGELAKVLGPLGSTPVRTLPSVIAHVLETGKVSRVPNGPPTVVDRPLDATPEPTVELSDAAHASVATTLQQASGVVAPQKRASNRLVWLAVPAVLAVGIVAFVIAKTRPVETAAPAGDMTKVVAPPLDAAIVEVAPPDAAVEVVAPPDAAAVEAPPAVAPPIGKPPKKRPVKKPPKDPFGDKRI